MGVGRGLRESHLSALVKNQQEGGMRKQMFWRLEEQELHFLAPDVSPRKIEVGGAGLLLPFPFFLFCLFFPDASTMEAMTSPNKKSGNKLHWIRMLGWMDDSRVV